MTELQIHNIEIKKEPLTSFYEVDTGGGYRNVSISIVIDSSRPIREQRCALIQEILGAYLGSVVQLDTLEEMAEKIRDSLEELDGNAD